jgi:hypothetical protein
MRPGDLHIDCPCGRHHVREVEGPFSCKCGRLLEVLWNAPYLMIPAPKATP